MLREIKDSIDFLSLGGLVKGLTIDDITLVVHHLEIQNL